MNGNFALCLALVVFCVGNWQQVDTLEEKEWWQHASFYQIYPRSFKDSNGDGIGDIQGIISKLDHLKDAGITACWLSPFFKSPQVDLGYDVSDFYTIQPEYGTMADFDELMDKANSLNIKLMLDFIPNHTSNLHQWFIDSENNLTGFEDYYVWVEGKTNPNDQTGPKLPPNNWISVFGGSAWQWSDKRQKFYLHQFTKEQPDLNYRNQKVVDEMTKVLTFYMDKGCAGFRLDAINHMFEDPEFRDEPIDNKDNPDSYDYLNHIHTKDLPEVYDIVYKWRQLLEDFATEKGLTEKKILMTEAYADTELTMRYYVSEDGKRNGANMPFNFQLIYNFHDGEFNAWDVKRGIEEWIYNMPPGSTPNWVAGSHDHGRVASRVHRDKVDQVNAVVLTLPGSSITYYGEEIGMEDNKDFEIRVDNRDYNRTPMQWDDTVGAGFSTIADTWLPIHANYRQLNLKAQKEAEKSSYKFFQTLTTVRHEKTFMHGGLNMQIVNRRVLAYSRELIDHPGYIIAINGGDREERVDFSVFKTFPEKLIVVTAAPNSLYNAGDEVEISKVVLSRYDAVVFISGAAINQISIVLALLFIIKFLIF